MNRPPSDSEKRAKEHEQTAMALAVTSWSMRTSGFLLASLSLVVLAMTIENRVRGLVTPLQTALTMLGVTAIMMIAGVLVFFGEMAADDREIALILRDKAMSEKSPSTVDRAVD